MKHSNRLSRRAGPALALAGLLGLAPTAAHAAVTINIFQSGSDVDAQAKGTLDLTGLNFKGGSPDQTLVIGQDAIVLVGKPSTNTTNTDVYSGFTGPALFGSGGKIDASSGSGDRVGVDGNASELAVPIGYVSGDPLSGGAVFADETLGSLGLTPGTYTYTLPNDTLTVDIGASPASPAPEPSQVGTLALLGLGLTGLIARARRRQMAA